MVLLSLDSTDVQAEYEYPGLLIDACFTDSGITAVTDCSAIENTHRTANARRY